MSKIKLNEDSEYQTLEEQEAEEEALKKLQDREYKSLVKKFGRNYSWWDIPAYIRERDKLFKPVDKTAPYELYMTNGDRNKGESWKQYYERERDVFSERVNAGLEED